MTSATKSRTKKRRPPIDKCVQALWDELQAQAWFVAAAEVDHDGGKAICILVHHSGTNDRKIRYRMQKGYRGYPLIVKAICPYCSDCGAGSVIDGYIAEIYAKGTMSKHSYFCDSARGAHDVMDSWIDGGHVPIQIKAVKFVGRNLHS